MAHHLFRMRPAFAPAAAALTLLCFAVAPSAAQQASPPPCTSPEHRQFDFWLGEWTVTRPDGRVAGTNRIERIEGGCGLQENWTAATGGGTGRSINAYSPQDGRWHQAWLGSGGLWLHLSGGLRDGAMVLEGTVGRAPKLVQHRITWTPMDNGRVRQLWEQSADGGVTWTVAFDGRYSKRQ
jgi:hypothetical protein